MKRLFHGLVGLALLACATSGEAAAPRRELSSLVTIAQAAVATPAAAIADGTEILIESEAPASLHWSPSRGFHIGRNCCKGIGDSRGARVSTQRFAGVDAAAGRPVYVRSHY